ncbi:MAG: LPS-assembly protein LptD [Candidatus Omnitrophica bacterium]|nr:LPS-assembly protein LptD [Candidatus Omnitrophota bacterium]
MKRLRNRVAKVIVAASLLTASFSEPFSSADTPGGTASGGAPASSAVSSRRAVDPAQVQALKQLVARGAYREALQEADIILQLDPGHPIAAAYRKLCQERLQDAGRLTALTPGQLLGLEETLRREQTAQKRATAQAKALERQITRDQERWTAQLKQTQQEAAQKFAATQETAKAEAAKAEAEQQEAAQRAAMAAAQQTPAPEGSATPAPAAPQPSVAAAPSAPVAEGTVSPGAAPAAPSETGEPAPSAVELEPVRVPAAQPLQPSAEAEAPAFEEEEAPAGAPAGAVQIFGDYMDVDPNRQLARAQGHVRVVFKGGVLTCDDVTVFTDTKDIYAQGHVVFRQGKEGFRGELIHYNYHTKKGRFLGGTAFDGVWYEHGEVIENIAEGVMRVRSGYLTSCEFEPPHFRLQGQQATVFTDDKIARGRNATFTVEELPLIYLPWLTIADRQTPFFIIPGKNKQWGEYALGGYRYEWPSGQRGTLHMDWRRNMLWGFGLDHRLESADWGRGLLKLYYNDSPNISRPKASRVKGSYSHRYRALWRHTWQPMPDTTVLTNIQEFSDADFRQEFLFRDEYIHDDNPDTYISMVTGTPQYALNLVARKRMNRFDTVTESFPDATLDLRPQPIGGTNLFTESKLTVSNFQTKRAHSDDDTDVVRASWFQQLSYAMNLFRPILVTPKVGVRQTYYNKDKQGGSERPDGYRHLISGQVNLGADASLKLFRIFPVTTNWLGLNINGLRHVLSPSLSHSYVHDATVPSEILSFPVDDGELNQLSFGIENKLQTRRRRKDKTGKTDSVDLGRFLISMPYTFQGHGNKRGGRLGDWRFDMEAYPWPWSRLEMDWIVPSHFDPLTRDDRLTQFNLDWIMVGGGLGQANAAKAPDIQAPTPRAFQVGPQSTEVALLPVGQWYMGLGQRYFQNDKTEGVLQFDWRVSEKWQIGTFHRLTFKEVAGGSKRFNNVRELQYTLTRDLHDWIAELVYRMDREFGEEIFLTFRLKAFPEMPIESATSYHQPKLGSQSSPFSPVPRL